MIKSMTGYGHYEKMTKEYKVTVEMKSVNHRYCDLNIKLPKKFNALEGKLRSLMKEYVSRGKVDVYINFQNYADNDVKVQYHEKIASDYVNAIRKLNEKFGKKTDKRSQNRRFDDGWEESCHHPVHV